MHYIIIHGIQGHAGKHWQGWLSDQLKENGHNIVMETFPNSDKPDRKIWVNFLKSLTEDIPINQQILIGHSLGVVTAMDYIEQLRKPCRGLISVSGFARDYHHPLNSYFLAEKDIDIQMIRKNTREIEIFYGDDDPYVPPVVIKNGGHLNTDTGYTEFPQLLKKCLEFAEESLTS